eukprot:GABW01000334.1.p2 GENE.GABW01000334.1~~GABW01000334.1.p2  ORF type:complete len:61 (-),score=17.74 GABW01000334.1:3-185(-)
MRGRHEMRMMMHEMKHGADVNRNMHRGMNMNVNRGGEGKGKHHGHKLRGEREHQNIGHST